MNSLKTFFKAKTTDELLLAALVFFLPFERIPSIDIFGVSLRLSFIVAGVIIVRALLVLVKTRFNLVRQDLPVKMLLVFVFWILVTVLIAINVPRALQVVIFTSFTIMTAIAVRVLYKPEHLKTIINALLWSALLVATFGVYQYFGNMAGLPDWATGMRSMYSWQIFGFPRIHSTALEPLYYCSYLLIPISYLLTQLLRKKTMGWKYPSLFVLLVASLIMTLSRGGVAAFIGMLIVATGMLIARKQVTVKSFGRVVGLVVASIGVSMLIINLVSREPLNKTITGGEKGSAGYTSQLKKTSLDGSGDDRGMMRSQAISLYTDNGRRIIVGIGPGQFGPYIQDNKADSVGGWKVVNNETLELLLEYGLIGALILGIFLLIILSKAWQVSKSTFDLQASVSVALIAYIFALLIQYQTFSTLYIMHVWVVIGLLMALGANSQKKA